MTDDQKQALRNSMANTMCQLFLDIFKAIGLKDASSHSGRRTYITRLANKGVGVRLLAALAGHSHISTTQRYIDVNSDQLSEAVELLKQSGLSGPSGKVQRMAAESPNRPILQSA